MFCIIALSKTSVVKLYTCVNVMGWNKMLKWIEYFKVWISEVFILHNHISITEIRQQATLNYSSLHYDLPFSGDKQQPRLHYFKLRLSNHIFKCFPSLPHYLFSDELSFSLFAGASCRSGRLAKSSCSARPMARERTTIFPSLDTQRTHTLTTEQYTHTQTYTRFIFLRREVSCGLKNTQENRKKQKKSIKMEVSCRKPIYQYADFRVIIIQS